MNGNEECNHLCDLHTTWGHFITVTRTTTKNLIKDTTKQFVVVKTLVVVNHTGFSNLYFHSVSHRKVHGYCHFVVFVTISTLTGSTPCAGALQIVHGVDGVPEKLCQWLFIHDRVRIFIDPICQSFWSLKKIFCSFLEASFSRLLGPIVFVLFAISPNLGGMYRYKKQLLTNAKW